MRSRVPDPLHLEFVGLGAPPLQATSIENGLGSHEPHASVDENVGLPLRIVQGSLVMRLAVFVAVTTLRVEDVV